MGWINQKDQPKKKKQIMHISNVPSQPTCLPN
jgi:hypothetical protein